MLQHERIKINSIIYVSHLVGNPKGSHTEYNTDGVFHYQLLYKLSGEAVITYGSRKVREKAGCLRLLPDPSVFDQTPLYTADVIEQGESINIAFTSDSPLPREITVKKYSCSPILKQLFQKMHKYWYYKQDGYYYHCMSVLYDIFALIAESESTYLASRTSKQIVPAIEYIDYHFTKLEIDCDELAQLCHISHTYMTKLFKKYFGMSPNKYIISKKIQYACDLLNSKHYSVSDIAEMTGFSSAYYFSRVFKKYMGICPSEYWGCKKTAIKKCYGDTER